MTDYETYVGIDNGVSGALAVVHRGEDPVMLVMPVQRARKGNEVDVGAVEYWLKKHAPSATLVLEEPGGSKSAKAAASMAGSFHALRSVAEMMGYRWHRITPQQWQKVMLPGCKAGDTKERALAKARQLWPGASWLATDRCRTAHDGLVDAALIAEFARITRL
jgi:hypothetical protein